MPKTHDPIRVARELREKLAPEKRRLAFFCGAGISMAVGLPGIITLTGQVKDNLETTQKKLYTDILKRLPEDSNVENILDRVRIIRELIGNDKKQEYDGLNIKRARDLDSAICFAISKLVGVEPETKTNPHLIFAKWLRALHSGRDFPVEIFTLNYDLLLEQAMEEAGVPYFDGFVGAVAPFLAPESIEAEDEKQSSVCPPRAWTRLWKLHGSINWHTSRNRIVRLSSVTPKPGEELVIFPSREKYSESRKLPFLAFQDRLRKFLSIRSGLVIILGYSFSDEHINEMLLQGLRSNPRLAIVALVYGEGGKVSDRLIQLGVDYRNLTIYGPDKACIGGIPAHWDTNLKKPDTESFWSEESNQFTLGNFNSFATYLESFIGFKEAIFPPETDSRFFLKEPSEETPKS